MFTLGLNENEMNCGWANMVRERSTPAGMAAFSKMNIYMSCSKKFNFGQAVRLHPDDGSSSSGSGGGSKLLRNISQYLPHYTRQHPRRQPSL
jgi:hypothetical protein